MTDVIGQLQKYAHLVPDEYKFNSPIAKRFAFSISGLKILRDHPEVPLELQMELMGFVNSLEFGRNQDVATFKVSS